MAEQNFEPYDLAGSWQWDGLKPVQVWAGESQKVTESRKLATGVTFAKYEVYSLNAAGEAAKYDPAAVDGGGEPAPESKAHGFTAQPTTTGSSHVQGYVAGSPNHEALVWPVALTTFESRRAVFYGTGIFVEQLNGAAA